MAMRKICNVCGAINKPDEYDCWCCKNDIADEERTSIPNSQIGYQFFNKETGEYTNEPPTPPVTEESAEDKTPPQEPKVEPIQNGVKICKVCQKVNDATATECECGASLRRVIVQAPPAPQEKTPIIEDFSFDDEPEYQLIIGINGENQIPISFQGGVFPIGRDYQDCLENSRYVSRCHCFLRQTENGDVYLGERSSAPSTNGTFLRKIGQRKERLIPGKGYKISTGTVFYLGDTPVTFLKRS